MTGAPCITSGGTALNVFKEADPMFFTLNCDKCIGSICCAITIFKLFTIKFKQRVCVEVLACSGIDVGEFTVG